MSVSWLVAQRELLERIKTRSFISMAIVGPMLVLLITYTLFVLGGNDKIHWRVLIADPANIMDTRMLANNNGSISYDFVNDYVQLEDFETGKRYQKYDALLEVNEKILINKSAYLFYREKPNFSVSMTMQFQLERRLEEVLVDRFTKMSVQEYRKIKQPISVGFRNVYDPKNESTTLGSWVGFFFGAVILFFILLFGMTILRSVSSEKSNRIVEVLLASVKPRQLMFGKIAGIGIAAIIQLVLWVVIIAFGLFIMRETLFPDILDTSKWDIGKMASEVKNMTFQQQLNRSTGYNSFVELIYERIQFDNMLFYFLLFLVAGYIFYGTFFAALGATSGSENDGQQFIIPIVLLLLIALYAGYYSLSSPESSLTFIFSLLPFTSPMVCMVKLAQGYNPGEGYQLFVSFGILVISSLITLRIAGRLYTNGILQFGHRLRLTQFVKWLRNG
jgi:ABC-2 type transport system permease protein